MTSTVTTALRDGRPLVGIPVRAGDAECKSRLRVCRKCGKKKCASSVQHNNSTALPNGLGAGGINNSTNSNSAAFCTPGSSDNNVGTNGTTSTGGADEWCNNWDSPNNQYMPVDGGSMATGTDSASSLVNNSAGTNYWNGVSRARIVVPTASGGVKRKIINPSEICTCSTVNDALWRRPLKCLEQMLDARTILTLRQTAQLFYRHKYNTYNGVVKLSGFQCVRTNVLVEHILPLICESLSKTARSRIKLDFSRCTLTRDASLALVCERLHFGAPNPLGCLSQLHLDFCHRVTDKGLEALLTTQLPNLHTFSLRCARSKELTGAPFKDCLSADHWPSLRHFSCAFTNLSLSSLEAVAAFIDRQLKFTNTNITAATNGMQIVNAGNTTGTGIDCIINNTSNQLVNNYNQLSVSQNNSAEISADGDTSSSPPLLYTNSPPLSAMHNNTDTYNNTTGTYNSSTGMYSGTTGTEIKHGFAHHNNVLLDMEPCAAPATASIDLTGSWASKCLFEKLKLGQLIKMFCEALHEGDVVSAAKLSKKANQEVSTRVAQLLTAEDDRVPSGSTGTVGGIPRLLLHCVQHIGSKLLVNVPLNTCCDRNAVNTRGGAAVNVWSLPVSLALKFGDDTETALQLLIKRGAEVGVMDHMGKQLSVTACETGKLSVVKQLVTAGGHLDAVDLNRPSPLDAAIRSGYFDIAEYLLTRGANFHELSNSVHLPDYRSALYTACECNCDSLIYRLLKLGANPAWASPHNGRMTPALMAFKHDSNWLSVFLNAGVGAKDDQNQVLSELLSHAISNANEFAVELLVTKFPKLLSVPHSMWSFPHIQAAKMGRLSILKICLDRGSKLAAVTDDAKANNALHEAALEGQSSCAALLLERGMDVDYKNKGGQSALHMSCLENRVEVVGELLKYGADVNLRDVSNRCETPLMSCNRIRADVMALQLIASATNLNCECEDDTGRTALAYAFFYSQYSVADRLLERGADLRHANHAGETPFDVIMGRNRCASEKLLKRVKQLHAIAEAADSQRTAAASKDDGHTHQGDGYSTATTTTAAISTNVPPSSNPTDSCTTRTHHRLHQHSSSTGTSAVSSGHTSPIPSNSAPVSGILSQVSSVSSSVPDKNNNSRHHHTSEHKHTTAAIGKVRDAFRTAIDTLNHNNSGATITGTSAGTQHYSSSRGAGKGGPLISATGGMTGENDIYKDSTLSPMSSSGGGSPKPFTVSASSSLGGGSSRGNSGSTTQRATNGTSTARVAECNGAENGGGTTVKRSGDQGSVKTSKSSTANVQMEDGSVLLSRRHTLHKQPSSNYSIGVVASAPCSGTAEVGTRNGVNNGNVIERSMNKLLSLGRSKHPRVAK